MLKKKNDQKNVAKYTESQAGSGVPLRSHFVWVGGACFYKAPSPLLDGKQLLAMFLKMRKQARHGGEGRNPSWHSGGKCRRAATSLESACSTYQVPGQPGLRSNILSQNKR